MTAITRRSFLAGAAAAPFLANYHQLAAAEKRKVKITDIKVMALQGWRTFNFVRVDTDAGISGIAEAYGSPGLGVKEQILGIREIFVGKDPLEIDRLTTTYRRSDGSAHATMRAMSGVEMALWDLAGKILNVPASTLLGGRFRDKVRTYRGWVPKTMLDKSVVRDWADQVKADPYGVTAVKMGFGHPKPEEDPGRDLANRQLSTKELINIEKGYENCREALGWDHDIMVHCHWEFDLRTSIQLAEAVAPIKPLFLEDPLPVHYTDGWRRLTAASPVPICTGENWMRRAEALPFIVNHGCDICNPDLRNSGGFLETKRLADMADLHHLPTSNHNSGSLLNTLATVQWASSIRDYKICESFVFKGDWMDDIIFETKSLLDKGFLKVPTGPGLGVTLNREVVEAHLVPGEKWWG